MSAGSEYVDGHRFPAAPGDAPAGSEPGAFARATQQIRPGALPDSITALLRLPEVTVQADEFRCAVVICLPSHLAYALSALAPDPLQVQLAAQLVQAGEQDEDFRRELLERSR